MLDERLEFDARLFEAVGGKDIRDFLRVQKHAYEWACAYVSARRDFNNDQTIVETIKHKCKDRIDRQNRAKILAIACDMLLPNYLKQHDLAWFEEALGVAETKMPYSDSDLAADFAAFQEFLNEGRSVLNCMR